MRMCTWESGAGRPIYLELTLDDAISCSHPGRCDADVEALIELPRINTQITNWDPEDLREELKEYGAWEPHELLDHETNISRIVWLACCDVAENSKYGEDI